MNKKVYDITINDLEQGMYKVSLVDKPAIEENFIYFSEEEVVRMFTSDEKQEIVGPIMIPDKEILRFSKELGYYYVRFSREVIEEIMYKYSKEGLFNEFGIHHKFDTDDVVMLEVWMKESDNDKSKDYGYDLPNGTVFVKAKIESGELFNAIKDGEINGFSIEIKADIKQVNTNEEMNEFQFAKELGKLEAQFEAKFAQFDELSTKLEELYGMVSNWAEKIKVMEERSVESFTNEETGETTIVSKTQTEVEETFEEVENTEATVEETVEEEVEAVTEEVAAEVQEEEEEVNEAEVEEQFAAEQKAEEAEETPEDKTVVFNHISKEKVDMINDFFNKFK